METYSEPRALVENHHFPEQKKQNLEGLTDRMIDAPIVHLIRVINKLPSCFTLQCCYGHFLYEGQNDPENLDPIPDTNALSHVEYRIAYIAFCIDNSPAGLEILNQFKKVSTIDPKRIQFFSPDWFWERQINSYALQVEPDQFKDQDRAILNYQEALIVEKTRERFFQTLRDSFY